MNYHPSDLPEAAAMPRQHLADLLLPLAREALGLVLCGACALLTVLWLAALL